MTVKAPQPFTEERDELADERMYEHIRKLYAHREKPESEWWEEYYHRVCRRSDTNRVDALRFEDDWQSLLYNMVVTANREGKTLKQSSDYIFAMGEDAYHLFQQYVNSVEGYSKGTGKYRIAGLQVESVPIPVLPSSVVIFCPRPEDYLWFNEERPVVYSDNVAERTYLSLRADGSGSLEMEVQ